MALIGLTGSYGGLNTGDEAIFTCVIDELRRADPDVRITVFSRDAEFTRAHYDVDRVVPVRELTREEVKPEVERLDGLLLGGGGILYDAEAQTFLREVKIAQGAGVPTFAFAVGAGPLERRETRELVRDTLGSMHGVTVRDTEAKRLLEEIGVERDITLTADPALLLRPAAFTDDMLVREGARLERPLVGLSVREPGGAAPGLGESEYHRLLGDAADFIVRRFGADVLFIPMERVDIRHSHGVMANMTEAEHATVLKGAYRPEQILGLVRRLELVVGMRLHVLIFSAIGHVPFLPLPYAGKVTSFVRSLDLPVASMVQEGRAGPLLATIDELWDRRDERRRALEEAVPKLQSRARATVELALRALLGRHVEPGPADGDGAPSEVGATP